MNSALVYIFPKRSKIYIAISIDRFYWRLRRMLPKIILQIDIIIYRFIIYWFPLQLALVINSKSTKFNAFSPTSLAASFEQFYRLIPRNLKINVKTFLRTNRVRILCSVRPSFQLDLALRFCYFLYNVCEFTHKSYEKKIMRRIFGEKSKALWKCQTISWETYLTMVSIKLMMFTFALVSTKQLEAPPSSTTPN